MQGVKGGLYGQKAKGGGQRQRSGSGVGRWRLAPVFYTLENWYCCAPGQSALCIVYCVLCTVRGKLTAAMADKSGEGEG